MELVRYPTAAAFLADTENYLLQAEVENSLILGVAEGLARAPQDGVRSPYFVAVRDSQIRICAFSSLPRKLGFTRCGSDEALRLLARDAHLACPDARELHGPEPTAGQFAEAFAELRSAPVHRQMAQRIHQLSVVSPLSRVPSGRFRPAEAADLPLVASWIRAFMTEVGDSQGDPAEAAAQRIGDRQLYLWDDNGPVGMAAWTGRTRNTVRIALVYTPPDLRGRSYASACVTELSALMLREGCQRCCLYTDLANPTSNAIYHRIGYRPVCDAAMYALSD